ncbi:hypothetical protein [Planotetraspora kaengkrachanensis]|uniref:Uncharacterized protein n=1 Tax=Planotetraspora kaengkrachanensis TaxID=575193 RepID=A0A8J3Q074_9ACTN|nr:hypothetical protein [Planotetraspora kaengkrachanensis]GIG84111.1 hypothetical protein Pka01_72380 [Planotetraspora kaengkrachanensis]
MLQTTVLAFLAGALGANATPHFVKGITGERFPTVFGSAPLINLIGGWILYVVTALLVVQADVTAHPAPSFVAASLGVLLMGVFHAHVGAFGKKVTETEGSAGAVGP